MNILITNDDGYQAKGIQTLYQEMKKEHNVLMVAPAGERSAIGHGITLNSPIRVSPVTLEDQSSGYAVSGTPVDCVKFALFEFFNQPPDLVLSGINPGSNTGININYSGTTAAAREASLNGIPALAVSIMQGEIMDFTGMAQLVSKLVKQIQLDLFKNQTFLNLNAPAVKIDINPEITITRQAPDNLSTKFLKRTDPKGNDYFWYARAMADTEFEDTDVAVIEKGKISISPIRCDATDHVILPELAQAIGLKG